MQWHSVISQSTLLPPRFPCCVEAKSYSLQEVALAHGNNSWYLLAGFILRIILAPWLPEAEICKPSAATTCLEPGQCFMLTLSCDPRHAQADECPGTVQTNTRGNGFALHPDMSPGVKKGFCSGISI